jgi:iron complex outermembrane recepter protein
MNKKLLILLLGVLFILFLGGIPQIFAQETSSSEFTLEEITVTAQKREETQQKVAIPMDVISGDQLAETGEMNVNEILSGLSNVMINYSDDGMRIGIRGLTNTDGVFSSLTISNPVVAVNLDGAYNRSSSAGQNLFDVERVEVLYGPQSTMYASNSPGGIVNVVTAAPNTDRYSGSASVEFGNYSLFTAQAMVNAPIVTNQLAMRLAGQMQKWDPYISGPNQTGEDTKSARLKTLWQPSEKFNATVTINYSKKANAGFYGSSVIPFDYQDGHWYITPAGSPPGTPASKDGEVTDPWTSSSSSTASAFNGNQISKGITGEIKWDTGIGSLSVVPQYNESNSDNQGSATGTTNPMDPSASFTYTTYTTMNSTQKGIEARMTSKDDFIFKWILGINYYKSKSYNTNTVSDPRATGGYFDVTDDDKAVFGNITYPFTDKFRGNGGIRFSRDKAQSVGGMFGESNAPEYNKPDYKLGFEYDMAANSMLYANYATSFRVNAFRTGIPPEKALTYTVGAKNRFFDNKLQLNAAAYYYDYQNVQVQASGLSNSTGTWEDEVVDPDGNPVDLNSNGVYGEHVLIINAGPPGGGAPPPGAGGYSDPWEQFQYGAFRTIGVDVSADWIITSRDKINLAVTYLNSKWTDCVINAYLHWAPEYQASNGYYYWPGDGMDYNGMTRTFSPAWTTNFGYEHNFELGTFGTLIPHIDFMYKTNYVLSFLPSEYPLNYQESYYTIDGNVTLAHSSGKWSLNAYIRNATNYAAKNMYGMGGMSITTPRTYGTVLSVKF